MKNNLNGVAKQVIRDYINLVYENYRKFNGVGFSTVLALQIGDHIEFLYSKARDLNDFNAIDENRYAIVVDKLNEHYNQKG
jgi:hypothetical protein